MNIKSFEDFAQKNGFDSMRFTMNGILGESHKGVWIDAYYGCFRIDGMAENEMLRTKQVIDAFGYEYWDFTEDKK